ncbi:MAG: pilus assembly PilX N-terminal domain-containing protein [Planctomycetota bacterium]|jgi:Tfp pilus assembly protein PilX
MFRKKRYRKKHRGIAMIVAMLFVMVFSALSVGMFSMSSGNAIVASNLHTVNEARSSAESGLEVVRYYLAQAEIPGTMAQSQWFDELKSQMLDDILPNAVYTNYVIDEDSGIGTLSIGSENSPVELTTAGSRSFTAQIWSEDNDSINIRVIGNAGDIERKIQGSFIYGEKPEPYSVFDFGVATKGPLSLSGNILLDGVNISVESDVYIESMNYNQTLEIIGNSQIAGDVKVVNPDGYVTLQGGQAGIGTDENGDIVTGIEAIQNHVEIGAPQTQFPIPNTSHFEQYVTGVTIDSTTDLSSISTLDNVRIAAGTNPTFTADTQINGVLFIEQPNVVDFAGSADITGIIVGDGDYTDNSAANQITFRGNVSSSSVAELPETFSSDLRNETGTFMMAPGFEVSMGGSFGTLNGCIAANGIEFFGNAGGIIGGSVLNYSDEPMELSGNSDLFFNRTGNTEIPVGFEPVLNIVIKYDPSDYDEVM